MNIKDKFEQVNTSEELMKFMDENIKYGWIGIDNELREKTIEEFASQYRNSTLEEILKTGLGVCFEQVELEKSFFERKNIFYKTYSIYTRHMCHTFLMYVVDGIHYKFEHSSRKCKGIFRYQSEEELLIAEVKSFCERHNIKNMENLKLVEYEDLKPHMTLEEIKKEFSEKENLLETLNIKQC